MVATPAAPPALTTLYDVAAIASLENRVLTGTETIEPAADVWERVAGWRQSRGYMETIRREADRLTPLLGAKAAEELADAVRALVLYAPRCRRQVTTWAVDDDAPRVLLDMGVIPGTVYEMEQWAADRASLRRLASIRRQARKAFTRAAERLVDPITRIIDNADAIARRAGLSEADAALVCSWVRRFKSAG